MAWFLRPYPYPYPYPWFGESYCWFDWWFRL